MGLLRWIVGFLVAACAVLFSVSNRQPVIFYITPLHQPLELPLYMIGLLLLCSGFLLGSFTVWLNSSGIRRDRRTQKRQIKTLEKELNVAHDREKNQAPPSDFFPALPKTAKK